MARTRSVVSSRVVVRERYYWPQGQLNLWTILALAASSLILGVFAEFITIQNRMGLGIPWLFPYGVTVGAISIFFILIELIMVAQRRLLPGLMMMIAFILLVLYLTGLIETAIQLFGPGDVNSNCQRYVNNNAISGQSVNTLAWLEQNNICSCWYAAFSFWLIGVLLFLWMLLMAAQVGQGGYE